MQNPFIRNPYTATYDEEPEEDLDVPCAEPSGTRTPTREDSIFKSLVSATQQKRSPQRELTDFPSSTSRSPRRRDAPAFSGGSLSTSILLGRTDAVPPPFPRHSNASVTNESGAATSTYGDEGAPSPTRGPSSPCAPKGATQKPFESINYWPSEALIVRTARFRPSTTRLGHGGGPIHLRHLVMWMLYAGIGLIMGCWTFLMTSSSGWLSALRLHVLQRLDRNPTQAWIACTTISTALSAAASAVCLVYPVAAGSGVPDVMAYLNGILFEKLLEFPGFIAKTISCILAVSSGLPLGVEGPLIHLGAIVGYGLPKARSLTLRINIPFITSFRNSKDARDFIAAGAAAGVAAAFRAPLGGVLFVMEEVASHFPVHVAWKTFICCTISTLTIELLHSYWSEWHPRARHGIPSGFIVPHAAVLFYITTRVATNVYAMIPAACLGLLGGVVAAFFTKLSVAILRWRKKYILISRVRKVLECAVVAFLFLSIHFLVALNTPCTPITRRMQEHRVPYLETWCGNLVASSPSREENPPVMGKKPDTPPGAPDAAAIIIGGGTPPQPHPVVPMFNPYASLSMNNSENSLHLLYSRETHAIFPVNALAIYFAVYWTFGAYAAGMFLSGGLMIPSLMIGALMGRIAGRFAYDTVRAEFREQLQVTMGIATWVDPGLFALVGSAAFLAGMSRLSFSLTIIMLELSGDLHQVLLIALAVLIAKTVADRLADSLYHTLLHIKEVPFLDIHSATTATQYLLAKDLLPSQEFVMLREMSTTLRTILCILTETSHAAFPITADHSKQYRGIITREYLVALLYYAVTESEKRWCTQADERRPGFIMIQPRGTDDASSLPDLRNEIDREESSRDESSLENTLQSFFPTRIHERIPHATLEEIEHALNHLKWNDFMIPDFGPRDLGRCLDLRPYCDSGAFLVLGTCSAHRAHTLFCALALRHLVVVDDSNHVLGMLTRRDFLAPLRRKDRHQVDRTVVDGPLFLP